MTLIQHHMRQLQRRCTSHTERGHDPSPQPQDFSYDSQTYAAVVYHLIVSTAIFHVITWITTFLPTPKGWKAELAKLADP